MTGKIVDRMSHNIYYGKRIFDLGWGFKWPPILGCFCAVMGGGPFIVIKLHFSRTRARMYVKMQIDSYQRATTHNSTKSAQNRGSFNPQKSADY